MSRVEHSQYYTKPDVWAHLVKVLKLFVSLVDTLIIDPCAGKGDMIDTHFPGGLKFDLYPKSPGVFAGNMDTYVYGQTCRLHEGIVTNPPFNAIDRPIEKMNRMAASDKTSFIAVILPTRYARYPVDSCGNKFVELNRYFHLVHQESVASDSFAPAVTIEVSFQIWVRKDHQRDPIETMFEVSQKRHAKYLLKSTPRWFVRNASKEYLSNRGKCLKIKSPIRHASADKDAGANWICVSLGERWSHLSKQQAEVYLKHVMLKAHKNFQHGAQGFGPGHLIQAQMDLGFMK